MTFLIGVDLHRKLAQFSFSCMTQAFRQLGQQARPGLDQHDLQVFFRVNVFKPVVAQHPCCSVQLGRQFHPRGTAAHNRDRQQATTFGTGHGLCALQALISRSLKCLAACGLSSLMVCSAAPGVPKSLVWLPPAITSVS